MQAIGRETEYTVANNPGHASTALVEFSRAYALVATGVTETSTVTEVSSRQRKLNPARFA
ncbi:hypothetical protein [Streptomyces virginiae]|uniref:hypothetical protein n=1 Tax=Streptomyces virginiae TaxID=1961 RepID=UPI00369E456E